MSLNQINSDSHPLTHPSPSQGSSTPIYSSKPRTVISSPDLSSIDSGSTILNDKTEFIVPQSVPQSTSTPYRGNFEWRLESSINCSDTVESSDDEAFLSTRKRKRRLNQSKIPFKPKYDRLYKIVLLYPEDTLDNAKKWIRLYESNPSQAVTDFLQFILDICGYQDINLFDKFNYKEENYEEVIEYIKSNIPKDLKNSGKFLMKETSTACKQSQNAIFKFINNLIVSANQTKILYNLNFIKHVTSFLYNLIASGRKSLFYTGMVIIIELYTTITTIYITNIRIIQSSSSGSPQPQHSIDLIDHNNILSVMLERLGIQIEEHCQLECDLFGLKISVIENMWQWFEMNPEIITTTKYFKRLLSFVVDQHHKVRMAALNLCDKLVNTTKFNEQLNPVMHEFVKVVRGRLQDVSDSVVIQAINVFVQLINNYPDNVSSKWVHYINSFIFRDNRFIAIEAGKFLIACIYHNVPTKHAKAVILDLIGFIKAFNHKHSEILLVESILPNCPEICEWKVIVGMFMDNMFDPSDKIILASIMKETVHCILLGNSSIKQVQFCTKKWSIEDKRKVVYEILSRLEYVIGKNFNELEILKKIIQILLFIEYTDESLFVEEISGTVLIRLLRKVYNNANDEKLLMIVSETLSKLSETHSAFEATTKEVVGTLKDVTVYGFTRVDMDAAIRAVNLSLDDQNKIETYTMRLSRLLMFHDMTTFLKFEAIFNNWHKLQSIINPNSMKYLIQCGCWYLIWNLRTLLATSMDDCVRDSLELNVDELKQNFIDYLSACFVFVSSSKVVTVCNAAFESICDLTLIYTKELEHLEDNSFFKKLLPVIDNNCCNQFMDVIPQLIFEVEDTSTLHFRRTILIKILNMVSSGIIPNTKAPYVFQYYGSYYTEYGYIFERCMQTIRELQDGSLTVALISIHSMINTYTNVISEILPWDNLMALCKQFQSLFFTETEITLTIMQFGVKFALASVQNHNFLNYLKFFANSLPESRRKLLLKNFAPLLKQKNDVIKNFVCYVKYAKLKKEKVQLSTSSIEKTPTTTINEKTNDESIVSYGSYSS